MRVVPVVIKAAVTHQDDDDWDYGHAPGTHRRLPHEPGDVSAHDLHEFEVLVDGLHQHPTE